MNECGSRSSNFTNSNGAEQIHCDNFLAHLASLWHYIRYILILYLTPAVLPSTFVCAYEISASECVRECVCAAIAINSCCRESKREGERRVNICADVCVCPCFWFSFVAFCCCSWKNVSRKGGFRKIPICHRNQI